MRPRRRPCLCLTSAKRSASASCFQCRCGQSGCRWMYILRTIYGEYSSDSPLPPPVADASASVPSFRFGLLWHRSVSTIRTSVRRAGRSTPQGRNLRPLQVRRVRSRGKETLGAGTGGRQPRPVPATWPPSRPHSLLTAIPLSLFSCEPEPRFAKTQLLRQTGRSEPQPDHSETGCGRLAGPECACARIPGGPLHRRHHRPWVEVGGAAAPWESWPCPSLCCHCHLC